MTIATRKAIRAYCLVRAERYRITRDNEVHAYGSDNPCNRSLDYWRYIGTVDDVLAEIAKAAPVTSNR